MREIETSKAKPALASQAEKVSNKMADGKKEVEYTKLDQKANPENKDTKRSSRHKSAESR